jgi:hypothetical protein
MTIRRRTVVQLGMLGLAGLFTKSSFLYGLTPDRIPYTAAGALYPNDLLKWTYFGWEYDHPKSWSFMGGAVSPGQRSTIQFAVEAEGKMHFPDELASDRKQKIKWYLKEGYLPAPVSEWDAGPVHVKIYHFADRILSDHVTAVYSRVELSSSSTTVIPVILNVGAASDLAVPLSGNPQHTTSNRMSYKCTVKVGKTEVRDFVSLANGVATPAQLAGEGSFDSHYDSMKKHWEAHQESLAHPVNLPSPMLVDMFKALQITAWENVIKVGDNYEIHAAPMSPSGLFSYDILFSHDIANYIDQWMREGDCDFGKKVLDSPFYKKLNQTVYESVNYIDTIGKYLLPTAEYLRVTGDKSHFTPERLEDTKKAARNIHASRIFDDPTHYGLMKKSQDFENWTDGGDYLLCDNWSALHGLQAYHYICDFLGDIEEAKWAADEMDNLNDCLNKAIEKSCLENKTPYYLGAFDMASIDRYRDSDYSWVPYSGALSTFPWGAYLKGFELGGAWKDRFDASLEYSLQERDKKGIPEGSWGAWWGQVTYGSVYNASAGVQCLFSEKYRTEAIKNVEFMARNQCAPFQWSEAYEFKGIGQWVGMYTPPVSYGNYECWGYSFAKQALLQACASVKTDGTVILGRGVPDHWMFPGSVIEWANITVNKNKKINFRIRAEEQSLELEIWGDVPDGKILLNLPILQNNIRSTSVGTIDLIKGSIALAQDTRKVKVLLVSPLNPAEQD